MRVMSFLRGPSFTKDSGFVGMVFRVLNDFRTGLVGMIFGTKSLGNILFHFLRIYRYTLFSFSGFMGMLFRNFLDLWVVLLGSK